jgi:hypothetical protein
MKPYGFDCTIVPDVEIVEGVEGNIAIDVAET